MSSLRQRAVEAILDLYPQHNREDFRSTAASAVRAIEASGLDFVELPCSSRAEKERADRLGDLTREPRPGHATVTLESHCETSYIGSGDDLREDVDAEWWDALTDDERTEELQDLVNAHLENYVEAGADVVSRNEPENES